MLELAFQGMIEGIDTKEKSAHPSYKDMEQILKEKQTMR